MLLIKMKKSNLKLKNKGFTLIETTVALTIVVFIILGPLSLVSFSLKSARLSRNKVIASHLAQGTIEYVKNWRDFNLINGNPWLNGLANCLDSTPCSIDITNDNIMNCLAGPDTCPNIRYDITNGYNYSFGDDTIFKMSVTMEDFSVAPHEELKIEINVLWTEVSGADKTFVIEDYIFNWWGL